MAKVVVSIAIPLALFIYLFSIALKFPLNDPDVWWHLKTGDYILENWEVPDVDPFAYTTPRPLTQKQRIGVRSQWLGQVIFHLSNKIGGLMGVLYMRNLLIILPMAILFAWLLRRKMGLFGALSVTSLPAIFLCVQLFYSFERPQAFSFSIVLIAIILLERLKRECFKRKFDISYVLLPAIMAIWSNIHAGFIVGNVIIIIYAFSALIETGYIKLRRSETAPLPPVFYVICVLAVAASFLNPNTYHLFFTYLKGLLSMFIKDFSQSVSGGQGGWVAQVVLEFKPLIYFYKNLGYKWLLFYWTFTGILYVCMIAKYWVRRKIDLAELITVSFIVFFANYYARGLMFSLTVMPIYMGKTIMELYDYRTRFNLIPKVAVAANLIITIGFCTFMYSTSPSILKPGITRNPISVWFPGPAVSFLKENPIKPPMYNYYTWGGYLIWSLYPQYQVFIDGRAIDNLVSRTADSILKIFPGWNAQLNAYNINFMVIPVIFRESGHVIPLAAAMAYDDDWKLVFIKHNSIILARNVPQNYDIIRKYNRGKEYIFLEILKLSNMLLAASPGNPTYNLSKADALVALGNQQEADQIYNRYSKQTQSRKYQIKYLQFLRPLKR